MGYLSAHEHDIFVSYAHSDSLNDSLKRLLEGRPVWLPAAKA